jgi:predicted deacetylase
LKDVVTSYWFNYKMATIDMGDKPIEQAKEHILKTKYSIVTIHDVSPQYTQKILHIADELEKRSISYNFAVIPRHNEEETNDVRNNLEFIEKIKSYKQDIALHGLYHEHNGDLEEFRDLSFEDALNEIKKGMKILQDVGIPTDIFVPPTWTINKETIDALSKLQFNIVETEEEILILDKNTRLATNILNWDAGSELLDQLYRQINKRIFRNKVMGNTEMIRIALHPKDPSEALPEQCEMIESLIDLNYNFVKYSQIAKLFG